MSSPEPYPPGPRGPVGPGSRPPERGPSRAELRAEAAQMVTVLGRALAAQVARLAASADPAPDGWWFTPRTGA